MMNDIFQDLISERVVCVYLDDILISRRQWKSMTGDPLGTGTTPKYKLYLRHEQSSLPRPRLSTRLIISHDSGDGPVKIAGVAECYTRQQEGGTSFLGFTNFYRRFIQGFLDLARPLFDLTGTTQIALEEAESPPLRQSVSVWFSAPILMFRTTADFRVEADSSDFATERSSHSSLHRTTCGIQLLTIKSLNAWN